MNPLCKKDVLVSELYEKSIISNIQAIEGISKHNIRLYCDKKELKMDSPLKKYIKFGIVNSIEVILYDVILLNVFHKLKIWIPLN